MSKRTFAIAAAVIVASGCGSTTAQPSRAVTPTTRTTKSPKVLIPQRQLDALADRYRLSCNAPGATIGVRTRDGASHYAVAGHFAPGVPLTRDSQFLAGSVTKLFVATIALQLVAKHGGASPGAQTIVAYDQAHDATVAAWCNRLDPGKQEFAPSAGAVHGAAGFDSRALNTCAQSNRARAVREGSREGRGKVRA